MHLRIEQKYKIHIDSKQYKIIHKGVILILEARGLSVKKCKYINFEKEHLFEEHLVGCYEDFPAK